MNNPYKYFKLAPEVPGQLGEKTLIDNTIHPPNVKRLHFEFDGWLGDELIECFPCFLVTESLSNECKNSGLVGFDTESALITFSEQFKELYPNQNVPLFNRLIINGTKSDDFFIDADFSLAVSSKALSVIKTYGNINNCYIEEMSLFI